MRFIKDRSLLHKAQQFFFIVVLIASTAQLGISQGGVTITFGSNGLSSLKYNGIDFLSYGDLRLNQVSFADPAGSVSTGSTASTVSVDAGAQTQTRTYSWGKIVAAYTVSGNQLNMTVTVTNTSALPIPQIWFEALGLRFPSAVTNYDGSNPIIFDTLGQPAVALLQSASAAVAIVADDVAKPLQLGVPYAQDRPANTQFPVDLNTGTVSSYPNSFPVINRSIPAGGSDQFKFSLRFGPGGSTSASLAADVYRNFAATFPSTLNWTDRRAIGQLILGTSAAGYATNPRGWFLDNTIDVTNPAGIAAFQQKVLSYASSSIAVLKQMNAQGMITWDIEGEQFTHPTTYIGDPRLFETLAPEMAGIADQYFQAFRTAGFRVGVCLRPQQLQLAPGNTAAQQIPLADPTQILLDKATYAHNRWGATLFYIDSNVNATDPNPTDPAVIRTLSAAFPDSLFIPEHSNAQYFAYSAPYRELRQGFAATPADVRLMYPKAFTIIYTPDGSISQNFNALVGAVQAGDILMYRSWFADPQNAQVLSVYQAAAGAPASVSISVSPVSLTILAGQTQQFIATVTGASNTQVTWSVSPAGAGTISAAGLYTAPLTLATAQTISVIAASVADPLKAATSTVTITPLTPVSVSVAPASVSLSAGQTQQFSAAVTGSPNTQVAWTVLPAGAGSVSAGGLYTAPASIVAAQTVSVTATSLTDASKSASATVALAPPVTVSACPSPATNAFMGCYYNDRGYTQLAFSRTDPQINFTWGGTGPGGGVGPTQYAVRWQGNYTFSAGNYLFTMSSDDGSRLFVDGRIVIDQWGEHPASFFTATVALSPGTHLIRMDYFQLDGGASANLNWNLVAAIPIPTPLSVTVSPSTASLFAGKTQQLSAAVTGSTNQQVNWSVSPAAYGSISSTGLFTAISPLASQVSVMVTAASAADPTKSASAILTLVPQAVVPVVAVTVSPQTVTVLSGQMQPFASAVTGTANTQVLWSVSPANLGSISSFGIYTAPVVTSPQTVTVTAASVADPGKFASATVTVTPAATSCGAPSINAFTGCYYSQRTFDLSALAFTRIDPQIKFAWTGIGPGGTIGQFNFQVRWQGNFTFAAGNYNFTATSDDGSRLYIDGQLVIDYWGEHPAIPFSRTLALTAGSHLIQFDYMQLDGASVAGLSWSLAP